MTTEVRADAASDDDDRLPWLEPVEEEERGPSPGKLIAAVLIGLVAIGIVVGGLFWLGNRASGGGGDQEVIASPGDYKVPAPEPGGMQVDNKSSTQTATSAGTEPTASINQSARPEAPVTQPQQNGQQAAPQRPAQPAQPQGQAQAQPRPQAPAQPRLTGPTIQIGAYDSAAAANTVWSNLSQRFPQLRSLQHAVMTVERGGRTFYRLRAAGADAYALCRRLQTARPASPCMEVRE
jgi:FtsZ-interacting cell division protein ZipA